MLLIQYALDLPPSNDVFTHRYIPIFSTSHLTKSKCLHDITIEFCWHSSLGFTCKLLACDQCIMTCQYNRSTWKGPSEYGSSSRDCQNTAIVCAAGVRPYIYPKNIFYNDFLGSATIVLFCFC